MIDFFWPIRKRHLNKLKKQHATDKLRFLIETNHWNIYSPLPKLPDIAKLLNHKEKATLFAIAKLIHCGLIIQGLNGELYIRATGRDTHRKINYSGAITPE